MVPEVEDHLASCGFRFNRAKSATARTHAAATIAVAAQSRLKLQSLRLLVLGSLGLSRTNLIVVDAIRRLHVCRVGPGNCTPSRSQIPDVVGIDPRRAHRAIKGQGHVSSGPPTIPEGRISRFRFSPWLSPRGLSEMPDAQALARILPN